MKRNIRTYGRRAGVILALVALALATIGTQIVAAQTPDEAGDYSGSGNASLVDLGVAESLELPGGSLLDAVLAPTTAAGDTTGGLSHGGESDLTTFGDGTNVRSQLAGNDLLSDILVHAVQTAPPDNDETAVDELLPIDASPLLTATVARAEADARDIGTVACPADGVAARGWSEVAEAEVLPAQLPDGTTAVTLGETVSSESILSLTDVDGQSTKGVQYQTIADLTSLNLFGEADVEVVSPPTLTAVAGGTPGSASVTYSDPVVRINGTELVDELNITIGPEGTADLPSQLDPLEQALQPVLENLSPLFEQLGVTALRIEKVGVTSQSVADDGTSASAEAVLLQVELLGAEQVTLVSVDIAPMSAEANAPAGGVNCADRVIDVDKGGPDSVQPGDSFDYTIDVTNNNECTLENVTVTDVITGPAGSAVTATDPDADSVDGLTVTWNDQGPIEPGQTKSYTVTVQVPDDATSGESFSDEATADGTCDGDDITGSDTLQGPSIGAGGVLGQGAQMPRTGGGAAVAALGLLLGGMALRRRR